MKELDLCTSIYENNSANLIIIQGKSGSGKTQNVKNLIANYDKSKIFSYRDFTELIVQDKQRGTELCTGLSYYNIIAFEDVDFLKGKTATQTEFGLIVNLLLKNNCQIVITGINLQESVPILISKLNKSSCFWCNL